MHMVRDEYPDRPLTLEGALGKRKHYQQFQPVITLAKGYTVHWDQAAPAEVTIWLINFNKSVQARAPPVTTTHLWQANTFTQVAFDQGTNISFIRQWFPSPCNTCVFTQKVWLNCTNAFRHLLKLYTRNTHTHALNVHKATNIWTSNMPNIGQSQMEQLLNIILPLSSLR